MGLTSDRDIRAAFHRKRLGRHHRCPETVVIDELGLLHGKGRIDVAVLNGSFHGFEIKSAKDTTRRLKFQTETYSQCLEYVSVVAAEEHLAAVFSSSPSWFGVIRAREARGSDIAFVTLRKAGKNPNIDLFALAHLLWRSEALDLVRSCGLTDWSDRAPRAQLYERLAESLSLRELLEAVKLSIMKRENWRDPQRLVSYGDSFRPIST